jgi:DNA-binding response OmpR family regulator
VPHGMGRVALAPLFGDDYGMARIFLIEDNESIREAVSGYLRLDDHEVMEFGGVARVVEAIERTPPDVVLLDVMLPDGNGFALAKRIRAISRVPLVFLTAREAESDRITGFELGADDYVVKPFSPKELVLRVRALLRRSGETERLETGGLWTLGGATLRMDVASHRLTVDDAEIALTGAEWKILEHLAAHHGIVVSRERLLGESLGYAAEGSERTVDTHVKNLRAKLGEQDWIQTVRGYGYRFAGQARAEKG